MDCVFCALASGEIPTAVVGQDEAAVAFLDQSPKSPGHTLVVPRRHVADLAEDSTALVEIAPLVAELSASIPERLEASGVNLQVNSGVAAGQEVFHLHVHIVPRYDEGRAPEGTDAVRRALSL